MEETKHIIWDNRNLDIDDWRDGYEEFCEINELEYNPTDENLYKYMEETNNNYLDDEKCNLDIDCRQVVCIADVGRWDGRRKGFRFLGMNVNSIFLDDECDYHTFYSDGDEVRCDASHHDGTNHYLFRQLKDGVGRYEFQEAFCSAKIGSLDEIVEKYTDSLAPIVNNVYGW